MAVSGIQNPNVLAAPSSLDASSSGALDRNAFMKMLIAQLKNQDPMSPMDGRDFITQLSQLTGVEQLTSIGDRISSLQVATAGVANTQTSELVGKTIEAKGDSFLLDDMGPGGTAFTLDQPATEVTVKIVNENGDVVQTMTLGEQGPGEHDISWDGKTSEGVRAPAGRYHVTIEAKDASGKAITANTDVKGVVGSVSYEHGYPELVIGNRRVALGNVTSIGN